MQSLISFSLLNNKILSLSFKIFLFSSFFQKELKLLYFISPFLISFNIFCPREILEIKYFVSFNFSSFSNSPSVCIPFNNIKDSISFSSLKISLSLIIKLSILLSISLIIYEEFNFFKRNNIVSPFNEFFF